MVDLEMTLFCCLSEDCFVLFIFVLGKTLFCCLSEDCFFVVNGCPGDDIVLLPH